jgi:tetratricopeptide (TPR) repeat protein
LPLLAEKGTLMDSKISKNKGKKKALIIAISNYDNFPKEKQLPFCKNDGEEIYQILQKQGYEIPDDWKLIGTVTSKQLRDAIFDFFRNRTESKDTLLFYFSGHGIPDGYGGHYLAPSDIKTDLPEYYGFRFTDLEDQANKSPAKKIITILDCCFSGAAEVKGNEDDVAKSARSDMERTFKEGDGKCVLASSLADQVSYKKKDEPYSLFTYCLLEGLKGGNGEAINLEGYVTPYSLGNYVYDRITSIDRRQKPITKTEMSGEIILAYYPQLVQKQEKELARISSTSSSLTKGNDSASQSNLGLGILVDSARDYYVRGEYKKANIFFEKVLEIEPNNIEALNSKGISLYRLGEYEGANSCFNKVLKIDPKNIVALNNLEIQHYDDEHATGGDLTVPFPHDADAWNNKGYALANLGKYKEAIKCYDRAIKVDPNNAEAWCSKGSTLHKLNKDSTLHKLNKYKKAIVCYDKALEIDPNYAEAWYSKGDTLDSLGKHEEAIKHFDNALKIDPDHARAWKRKGDALYKLDKYDEAIKCYDKALEIDPNYAEAWYNKGYTLGSLGKNKDADKCIKKAKELGYKDREYQDFLLDLLRLRLV